MSKDSFFKDFKAAFQENQVFENEPMKNHTTFKAGGNADLFFLPKNSEQVYKAVSLCRDADVGYYVCGNGSNLLVRDGGFKGVIIKIGEAMSQVSFKDNLVTAQAGILMSELSALILKKNLAGFEFASGIPGSLGGAVCMNAGAYDFEMKDILLKAEILNLDGEILMLLNGQGKGSIDSVPPEKDLRLGYRTSAIQNKSYVVLSATLCLEQGEKNKIVQKINELTLLRKQRQPLEFPSAGSTFKRPPGHFAGKLIMDSGLKGFSIGGAMVSEKHSGFIINYNSATATDIINLIEHVRETVMADFGVMLEPEVKIIGDK